MGLEYNHCECCDKLVPEPHIYCSKCMDEWEEEIKQAQEEILNDLD